MVKKIGWFMVYVGLFCVALLCFLPKEHLYYYAAKEARSVGIELSSKKMQEDCFDMEFQGSELYWKSLKVADVETIAVHPWLFYNTLELREIGLAGVASSFAPLKVERFRAVYSLVHPLSIRAKALGEFGDAAIEFGLSSKNLRIVLNPSEIMRTKYAATLKNFQKLEEGAYLYEQNLSF